MDIRHQIVGKQFLIGAGAGKLSSHVFFQCRFGFQREKGDSVLSIGVCDAVQTAGFHQNFCKPIRQTGQFPQKIGGIGRGGIFTDAVICGWNGMGRRRGIFSLCLFCFRRGSFRDDDFRRGGCIVVNGRQRFRRFTGTAGVQSDTQTGTQTEKKQNRAFHGILLSGQNTTRSRFPGWYSTAFFILRRRQEQLPFSSFSRSRNPDAVP